MLLRCLPLKKQCVSVLFGLAMLIILAIVLTGCGDFIAGRAIALDRGGSAADEALITAEAYICRVATVGSVQRRFMRSEEDWRTWNDLCRSDDQVPLPE